MIARCAAIVIAFALGGCMLLGPNYKRPDLNLPGSYPENGAAGALAVPSDWWRLYNDGALDSLVKSGFEKNADIRLAIARIEEAEGLLREANASFLPEIDANVNAGRARSSTRTGTLPPS